MFFWNSVWVFFWNYVLVSGICHCCDLKYVLCWVIFLMWFAFQGHRTDLFSNCKDKKKGGFGSTKWTCLTNFWYSIHPPLALAPYWGCRSPKGTWVKSSSRWRLNLQVLLHFHFQLTEFLFLSFSRGSVMRSNLISRRNINIEVPTWFGNPVHLYNHCPHFL